MSTNPAEQPDRAVHYAAAVTLDGRLVSPATLGHITEVADTAARDRTAAELAGVDARVGALTQTAATTLERADQTERTAREAIARADAVAVKLPAVEAAAVTATTKAADAGAYARQAEDTAASLDGLKDAVDAAVAQSPADSAVATVMVQPGTQTRATLETTAVTRHADGPSSQERWYMGPKGPGHEKGLIYLEYHSGWLAHRVSIGGVWDKAIRTAPTIEVFPASPFARPDLGQEFTDKVGANAINPVTCLQTYAFGHGDTADRAYWCVEPHLYMNRDTGEYTGEYVITTHASGTQGPGIMPVLWRSGNIEVWRADRDGFFEVRRRLTITDKALDNSIRIWRSSATNILESRTVTNDAAGSYLFMSKGRGTLDAPTPPLNGDALGDVRFGFIHSEGQRTGAIIRAQASQNWTPGSVHGSWFDFRLTMPGKQYTDSALMVTEGVTRGALSMTRGGAFVALEGIAFDGTQGQAGPGAAATFLGRAGGTYSSPTAPGNGAALAEYRAGSYLDGSRVYAGALSFRTTQAWTDTARGTKAELSITLGGTTTQTTALELSTPGTSLDTAAVLLMNVGGEMVTKRVTIGPPDSAGTGYRALRITN